MKVRRLITNLPPFQDKPIVFQAQTNFIRGKNGAGKTTVLEAIALAGHMPILQWHEHDGQEKIVIRASFYLSAEDVAFLRKLFPGGFGAAADESIVDIVKSCLAAPAVSDSDVSASRGLEFWSKDSLRQIGDWLAKCETPESTSFSLSFLPGENEPELKVSLTDDARLSAEWRCVGESEAVYRLVGLLLSWSRPERCEFKAGPGSMKSEERWRQTPRMSRLVDREFPHPGIISYINTDMYNFGVGLDLRESPKNIAEGDMRRTVVDRLQLFKRGDKAGVFQVRGLQNLQTSWSSVMGKKQALHAYEFHQTKAGPPSEGACVVSLGETQRTFMSSGENQLLFVLSMIHAIEPKGSILMIDEPELHMSFRAQKLLIDRLRELAGAHHTQLLMATHIPFLFRESLAEAGDVEKAATWVADGAFPKVPDHKNCHLVYLRAPSEVREDEDQEVLFNEQAYPHLLPVFQQDLRALTESLELEAGQVKVWPKIWKPMILPMAIAACLLLLLIPRFISAVSEPAALADTPQDVAVPLEDAK